MKRWLRGGRVFDPVHGTHEIRDVFWAGGAIVAPPADPSGFEPIDCAGKWVAPAFIDLHGLLADFQRDGEAALAGGFTTVVLSVMADNPIEDALGMRGLSDRAARARCRTVLAGALTCGLQGETLTDVGLMLREGCGVLSHGNVPVADTRVLRNALAYAARFEVPVFLRPVDAHLDSGACKEGPSSVLLGLRGIPAEAEEIGVCTIVALARLTGARVHLTHLWSRRGVDAVRAAKASGSRITASTTVHHLSLDHRCTERLAYHGHARFHPPLGDDADREALLEGLRDGTLDAVATDHHPVPPHLKDLEFERARPGAVALQTAVALLQRVSGDPAEWIRWLTVGPARVLGQEPVTLQDGVLADLVVIDPKDPWEVSRNVLCSRANTPLLGEQVSGRVVLTLTNL